MAYSFLQGYRASLRKKEQPKPAFVHPLSEYAKTLPEAPVTRPMPYWKPIIKAPAKGRTLAEWLASAPRVAGVPLVGRGEKKPIERIAEVVEPLRPTELTKKALVGGVPLVGRALRDIATMAPPGQAIQSLLNLYETEKAIGEKRISRPEVLAETALAIPKSFYETARAGFETSPLGGLYKVMKGKTPMPTETIKKIAEEPIAYPLQRLVDVWIATSLAQGAARITLNRFMPAEKITLLEDTARRFSPEDVRQALRTGEGPAADAIKVLDVAERQAALKTGFESAQAISRSTAPQLRKFAGLEARPPHAIEEAGVPTLEQLIREPGRVTPLAQIPAEAGAVPSKPVAPEIVKPITEIFGKPAEVPIVKPPTFKPSTAIESEYQRISADIDDTISKVETSLKKTFGGGGNELSKQVRARGGISSHISGELKEEYNGLPLNVKRKTGLPGDEMAAELGMTEVELYEKLNQKAPEIDFSEEAKKVLEGQQSFIDKVERLELLEREQGLGAPPFSGAGFKPLSEDMSEAGFFDPKDIPSVTKALNTLQQVKDAPHSLYKTFFNRVPEEIVTKAGDTIINAIGKRQPTLANRLTYYRGRPKEFLDTIYKLTGKKQELIQRYILPKTKELTKLSPEEDITLGKYIRKEEVDIPSHLREVGDEMRGFVDRLSYELMEQSQLSSSLGGKNFLAEKTFFDNVGRYMPRFYTGREFGEAASEYVRSTGKRVPLERFKHRGMTKDVPFTKVDKWIEKGWKPLGKPKYGTGAEGEAVKIQKIWRDYNLDELKEMGMIEEASYPYLKGTSQMVSSLETLRAYNNITKIGLEEGFISETPIKHPQYGELVALPESAALGPLAGKYVPSGMHFDLTESIPFRTEIDKLAKELVSAWKVMKVPLQFSTMARNFLRSNPMLMDMFGETPPWRVDTLKMAMGDWLKETQGLDASLSKEIASMGGFKSGTYGRQEISRFLETFDKTKAQTAPVKIAKAIGAKAGNFYGLQEEVYKRWVYANNRSMGKMPRESFDIANESVFDYGAVPQIVESIRTHPLGAPFGTFKYKFYSQLPKAIAKHPFRVLKWFLLPSAIGAAAMAKYKISADEELKARQALPKYARNNPWWIPVYRDENGKIVFYDATYDLPMGDLADVWEKIRSGELPKIPQALGFFSMPQLSAPISLITNEDLYSGRKIVEDFDPIEVKVAKWTQYVWAQTVPNWIPGAWGAKKIQDAILKTPSYQGEIPAKSEALLYTLLGIKTRRVTPEMGEVNALNEATRDINEIKSLFGRKIIDPSYSLEQLKREKEVTERQIEQVNKELKKVTGKEVRVNLDEYTRKKILQRGVGYQKRQEEKLPEYLKP